MFLLYHVFLPFPSLVLGKAPGLACPWCLYLYLYLYHVRGALLYLVIPGKPLALHVPACCTHSLSLSASYECMHLYSPQGNTTPSMYMYEVTRSIPQQADECRDFVPLAVASFSKSVPSNQSCCIPSSDITYSTALGTHAHAHAHAHAYTNLNMPVLRNQSTITHDFGYRNRQTPALIHSQPTLPSPNHFGLPHTVHNTCLFQLTTWPRLRSAETQHPIFASIVRHSYQNPLLAHLARTRISASTPATALGRTATKPRHATPNAQASCVATTCPVV